MTTIVSAFLSDVNRKYPDALERYCRLGRLLLQSTTPKVVFVDETMAALFAGVECNETTLIVPIQKGDLYLYDYAHLLSRFDVNTTDATKDTAEFMLTMCSKPEWVRKAVELDPFTTDHFVWVDFGIRHVFRCSDEAFVAKLDALKDRKHPASPAVRIGGIWDLSYPCEQDVYKEVLWYFAGGVFGGSKETLLHFANAMRAKCVELMTEQNTLMWEVNVWYLLHCEQKVQFDTYLCDHNDSIVDNY